MKRYTDLLTDVIQRGTVPTEQQVRIQAIADRARDAFADVNTLLNDLAEHRAADAASLRQRLKQAPVKLTRVLTDATAKLKQPNAKPLKMFAPVIKESAKVAESVAKAAQEIDDSDFSGARQAGPLL